MIKISVVIPVYNMSHFIEKCLNSLCNQTYSNFEAIIVDDGSTDDSFLKIQPYLVSEKFKYFRKENGGLISANSYGIRHSSGDFICFLDPDDYYGPDFLSNFVKCYVDSCDVISMGFNYHTNKKDIPFSLNYNFLYGKSIIRKYIFSKNLYLSNDFFIARWNKMYKKSLVLEIVDAYESLPRITTGEDSLFNFLILQNNPQIFVSNTVNSYFYNIENNSMTRVEKDYKSFLMETNTIESICENLKKKYDDKDVDYLEKSLFLMIGLNYINSYIRTKKSYYKVKNILKTNCFNVALNTLMKQFELGLKSRIKYKLLLKKKAFLYVFLYKIYNF